MEVVGEGVAVVTGAASGIGRATALRLAKMGMSVVVADLNGEGADRVSELIRDDGGVALTKVTDVTSEPAVKATMRSAVEQFGRLDVVANVAADLRPELHRRDDDIATLEVEVWDHTMAVNLRGAMLGCKHAIPLMLTSGGGSIVNVSSTGGILADVTRPAYSVSKAAIMHLTKCVAVQYGKRGILCNAVAPGFTLTESMLANTTPEMRTRWEDERNVVPKFGKSDDIAEAIAFLATGGAGRYITGQTLVVDGGNTIKAGGIDLFTRT